MTRTLAEATDTHRFTESPDLMAKLTLVLGSIGHLHDRMDKQDKRAHAINQAIYPVSIPARSAAVTSGGALNINDGEALGPRGGQIWDVHRVSVFGLHAATEVVGLFKTPSGSTTATVAQNFICALVPDANQIAGSFGAFKTFGKGQLVLRANESLQIQVASGLTANEVVTLSGDATCVEHPFVGDYFL